MRRPSLSLAVPLAAMALPLLPLAHAEELVPPPPPAAMRSLAPEYVSRLPEPPVVVREAPAAVKDAIAALATACAAWPKPAPLFVGRIASPADVRTLPEDDTCEMLAQPGRVFTLALWFSGILGGAVTIAGLVGFCFLRMVLVQMWTWRPRAAAQPWR